LDYPLLEIANYQKRDKYWNEQKLDKNMMENKE